MVGPQPIEASARGTNEAFVLDKSRQKSVGCIEARDISSTSLNFLSEFLVMHRFAFSLTQNFGCDVSYVANPGLRVFTRIILIDLAWPKESVDIA